MAKEGILLEFAVHTASSLVSGTVKLTINLWSTEGI